MSNPNELALACLEQAFGPGAVQHQGSSGAVVSYQGHQVEVACRVEHPEHMHENIGSEPHYIMQVSLPTTLPGPLTLRCHRRANSSIDKKREVEVNAPSVTKHTIVTGYPREVIQRVFQSPELVAFFEAFPSAENMLLSQGKLRIARTLSDQATLDRAPEAQALLEQVSKFLPVPTEPPRVGPPVTAEYLKSLVEGMATSHRVLTSAYQEHLAQLQNQGGPNAVNAFMAQAGQEVEAEDTRRRRSRLLFNLILFGAVLAVLLLIAGIFGAIFLL